LVSSLDRFLISKDQYAAVIAAVLVDLANGDRATQHLGTLTINERLVAAAQAKANDMAAKSYFAHVSPEGVNPWHWFTQAGYKFEYAGENLAVDFNDSADVNSAWMNSPTHRQNILDPHFTEIGIAIAQGMYQGRPTTFVVQEFGSPASQSRPIASQTVPKNPTTPAVATVTNTSVLGEETKAPTNPIAQVQPPPKKVVLGTNAETSQKSTPAAAAETPDYAPWWQHLIASPKQGLHTAYYLLALLVFAGLLWATELELRWHHRKKAAAAGFVLAVICLLFVIGDRAVFPSPSVPEKASMTAAAASAF